MKTMTCNQLGGACDQTFQAETWEEMAELSQKHGMEMAQKQEPAHLEAMEKMKKLMLNPVAMQQWIVDRKAEFDALTSD